LTEAYTSEKKDLAPQKIIDVFGGSIIVTLNASFREIVKKCRKEIDSRYRTKALTVKCIEHEEYEVPSCVESLILPCLRTLKLQFTTKDGCAGRKNYFEKHKSLNEELWKDNTPQWNLYDILNTLGATDFTRYSDMVITISIDKFNVFCLDKDTLIVAFLDHQKNLNFFKNFKRRPFRNVALLECQTIPDLDDLFESTKTLILQGTTPENPTPPTPSKKDSKTVEQLSFDLKQSKPEIKHTDVVLINPEFDEQMVEFLQNLRFQNCYVLKNPNELNSWSDEIKDYVKDSYGGDLDDSSFLLINHPRLTP